MASRRLNEDLEQVWSPARASGWAAYLGIPDDSAQRTAAQAELAIARTAGWITHWMEMITEKDQKIGRPRQLYIGATRRDVPSLAAR